MWLVKKIDKKLQTENFNRKMNEKKASSSFVDESLPFFFKKLCIQTIVWRVCKSLSDILTANTLNRTIFWKFFFVIYLSQWLLKVLLTKMSNRCCWKWYKVCVLIWLNRLMNRSIGKFMNWKIYMDLLTIFNLIFVENLQVFVT